jgi:hypothetical protein
MTFMGRTGAWLWWPFFAFTLAACGSSEGAVFDGGGADARSGHDGGSDAPNLLGEGGGGGGGNDAACATDHAKATPSPAFLVIIMDHSDSMGQDEKWKACSAALDSFFSSKTSIALSASLTWLPFIGTAKGDKASCVASDYETPAIPMTALPSSTFVTAITDEPLQLGTPTLAALTGSVTYAASVQKANPGGKVLIVLATDGLPAGCTGNTLDAVATEAASALSMYNIPTYVIGVGTAVKNLNQIAASGGTKSAFLLPISPDGGAGTTAAFEDAIKTIQGTLGCEYPIPSPSGGAKIDYSEVNVELTSGGKETELMYSADCSNTDGWHYDNPSAPTSIILCSGACTEAEDAASGSMDIVFGCKTNGFVP